MRYTVFCADPLAPRSVDPGFARERRAAEARGFVPVLIDHDELDRRIDPAAALRRTRIGEPGVGVYRGWMLCAEAYAALHDALAVRGLRLLTDATAYAACHHAPASYDALAPFMPEAVSIPADALDDPAAIVSALARFGETGVVVKDWVKSQAAGYWAEACHIPRATDTERALRVIARFRELQGDDLTGGVVLKAYVPLLPVGRPAHEHRAFVVDGRVVGCWPRSPEAQAHGTPPRGLLDDVASRVPSPFASADVGRDGTGRWWLLEVGDGQVSGLPADEAAEPMFAALAMLADRAA